MVAEWYLILVMYQGRETIPAPVPMYSRDACMAALANFPGSATRYFSRCINTKTGEVVKP